MKRARSRQKGWQDHYTRRAQKEKFPARSVYKLKEMQQKYNLIKRGDRVLDLGCAPGSWLLYAAERTGAQGQVVGIDLKAVTVRVPAHVRLYTADILTLDDEFYQKIGKDFHVVISDMAPATTGSKHVDSARSFHLCQAAFRVAQDVLVTGGSFVCKIFQGEDFKVFSDAVKNNFNRFKIFKPQSSRKASREIYIIGMGKK